MYFIQNADCSQISRLLFKEKILNGSVNFHCSQYLYIHIEVKELVRMRKKGYKCSDEVQTSGIPSILLSSLYSEFTLGGTQGKLNGFRNLALLMRNSLAVAMLMSSALKSAI